MITEAQLRQFSPRMSKYHAVLVKAMTEFDIITYPREAAFLAQIAHETMNLTFFEEIASGKAYENRKDLGNTQPGDGVRFKGRGMLMLTGRGNYKKYGDLLGVDLIAHPDTAAHPETSARIAGLYWKLNNLNPLADTGKFDTITKRINGGFNGKADRDKKYGQLKAILGVP